MERVINGRGDSEFGEEVADGDEEMEDRQ